MKQAIRRLLGLKPRTTGRKAGAPAPRGRTADTTDNPHTIEDNSDNGTRRQLVQVVLRDCQRTHGVPPGWIDCQMLVVNSRSKGSGLYLRLVMRQWDLRLLTYAQAFEKELRAAILEFEPQASSWLHGISWEFDLQAKCPYPDMPAPVFWSVPPPATLTATPAPSQVVVAAAIPAAATAEAVDTSASVPAPEDEVLKDLQDLQRMFAVGDAELARQSSDSEPVDFQNTVPSGLK